MQYEPSPKHKPNPSPGRRGSICPRDADASRLLSLSVPHGQKRYATDGQQAYCAQCHDYTQGLWHGYPVDWNEVPAKIVNDWIRSDVVRRRTAMQAGRRSR